MPPDWLAAEAISIEEALRLMTINGVLVGVVHQLGEAVFPWLYPWRSLIDANPGLQIAWKSDAPRSVTPITDLAWLVARKETREIRGELTTCEPPDWLAAERITVEEALQFMTINAAYTLFMEDVVGSLKPGKFADLIVLSDNPLTVGPDALIDLEVLMTMVGGRVEYCGQQELCPPPLPSGAGPSSNVPIDPTPNLPNVILNGQRECGEVQCYDVAVVCQGLPGREATISARHLTDPMGTVVLVGGGYSTGFYGRDAANELRAEGYEVYQIAYQGELGYLTGTIGTGLKKISCGTSELIRWIASDLADNPDVMGAHGLSAGSMQLGYGLAVHGLGDILDVVVLAAGPLHSDLVGTCFTYSLPARGLVLDYAHDWVGTGTIARTEAAPNGSFRYSRPTESSARTRPRSGRTTTRGRRSCSSRARRTSATSCSQESSTMPSRRRRPGSSCRA